MKTLLAPALRLIPAAALLVVAAALAGCSGPGGLPAVPTLQSPTPTNVIITADPVELQISASATLSAQATYAYPYANANTAVTWSMACGSTGRCGSIQSTSQDRAVLYTAPSAIPTGSTVTLTATSVADPNVKSSITITIIPTQPITVALQIPTPASMQVGSSFQLGANVSNDISTNPQVAWTVSCGSSACGTLNASTSASGSTVTYTAPAAIPGGGNVTLTATSATDPTKSASTTIAIVPAVATLANGTYVFQFVGVPGPSTNVTTGVLVANNGRITGGEQDYNYYSGDGNGDIFNDPVYLSITGGSYTTSADGNLAITVQLTGLGTETWFGTLAAGNTGFINNINGAATNGTLALQTSTAVPAGGFAFSLQGGNQYGDPTLFGGILNFDSPQGISGAGSVIDIGGTSYSVSASAVSAADPFGRFQIQLQPAVSSALLPITLAAYVVDPTHLRLMEIDSSSVGGSYQGVLGGMALGQGTQTGQYSVSSLAGSSYVFGAQGTDESGTLQLAGLVTFGANGTVSGHLNWNDASGKSAAAPVAVTGSYTLDTTGRVTLALLTDGTSFAYSFHAYLTSGGTALLLSNDAADTFSGQAFVQQSSALNIGALAGSFGLAASEGQTYAALIGTLDFLPGTGSGATTNISGFLDHADGGADFAATGSVSSNANGILSGTLAGLPGGAGGSPAHVVIYPISSTQALMMQTDAQQLLLGTLQTTPN